MTREHEPLAVDCLGTLRELLSTLTNLDQLLRSRNVAPKALTRLLPELLIETAPLSETVAACCKALEAQLPMDVAEISKHLLEQLEVLGAAFEKATSKRKLLTATGRLTLERSVGSVLSQISGIIPLLELMVSAVTMPPRELDVVELLRLSRPGDHPLTHKAHPILAALETSCEECYVRSTPQVFLPLLSVASSLVRVDDCTSVRMRLSCTRSGSAENAPVEAFLELSACPELSSGFRLFLPPRCRFTAEVFEGVAAQGGLTIEHTPSAGLKLRWSGLGASDVEQALARTRDSQ